MSGIAMAAESLIIGPTIQLGGARDAGGLEALQGILDEVRGSPEGALAFVLAKASLPASPSIAQAQEATRAAAYHELLLQLDKIAPLAEGGEGGDGRRVVSPRLCAIG